MEARKQREELARILEIIEQQGLWNQAFLESEALPEILQDSDPPITYHGTAEDIRKAISENPENKGFAVCNSCHTLRLVTPSKDMYQGPDGRLYDFGCLQKFAR